MKLGLMQYKHAKNITCYLNFVIGLKETELIFDCASWFKHVVNREK